MMALGKTELLWDMDDVYSYLKDQAEFYPHDPDYDRFAESVLRAMQIIEQHEQDVITIND